MEANTRSSRVSAGRGGGTSVYGARTGRKKPSPGSPSATTRTGMPGRDQRLGERQGVHHAAARLGRVGDQRDPRVIGIRRPARVTATPGSAASPVAIAAAASEARAAVSVTMAPASHEPVPLGRRSPAGRVRCPARSTTTCGPPPAMTVRTPARGSRPGPGGRRSRARRRAAPPRRRGRARFAQQLDAGLRVDHRVRPAPGVLLLAEVQALVRSRGRGQAPRRSERHVGAHRTERPAQDDQGLVAQRAAGEEAAHQRAARRQPRPRPPHRRTQGRGRVRRGHGRERQDRRARQPPAWRPATTPGGAGNPASSPMQAATTGCPGCAPSTARGNVRRRWLGDQQDDLGRGILAAARRSRRVAIRPPTCCGQVAAADADHLATPDAPPVEQRHDLLRAGAGGGDDADRPGADRVGEAQAGAAEHGRARARAHHQPAAAAARSPSARPPSPDGTLSLNSSTCSPAVRAWWAASAAYSPGTEITATFASGWAAHASAHRSRCGSALDPPPPSGRPAATARAASPAVQGLAAIGSSAALHRQEEVVGVRRPRRRPGSTPSARSVVHVRGRGHRRARPLHSVDLPHRPGAARAARPSRRRCRGRP